MTQSTTVSFHGYRYGDSHLEERLSLDLCRAMGIQCNGSSGVGQLPEGTTLDDWVDLDDVTFY